MKKQYDVVLKFRDDNMPKMVHKTDSLEDAKFTVSHWLKQFAAIKAIYIDDHKENERAVISATGEYMFSIPLSFVAS